MNLLEFKASLLSAPNANLRFVLPDEDVIEDHAHITEVGRVDKTFIDCGGTIRRTSTCLLQAWVAEDIDHRLLAGKLAAVLDKAAPILLQDDLEMEIEYEDCAVTQFPVRSVTLEENTLIFLLGQKHTDCLAKDVCLPDSHGGCC
jgi:hypothetical protein